MHDSNITTNFQRSIYEFKALCVKSLRIFRILVTCNLLPMDDDTSIVRVMFTYNTLRTIVLLEIALQIELFSVPNCKLFFILLRLVVVLR